MKIIDFIFVILLKTLATIASLVAVGIMMGGGLYVLIHINSEGIEALLHVIVGLCIAGNGLIGLGIISILTAMGTKNQE